MAASRSRSTRSAHPVDAGTRSAALSQLLPPHLVASLRRRRRLPDLPYAERFPAALLFADISGFTALTERLQERGREGAEEIAAVVNAAFAPARRAIDAAGGSIVTFGGDALFVLFLGAGRVGRALRVASEIREGIRARGAIETSAGPIELGVSQAVHHGVVTGLHLGRPAWRIYVVTGRPVFSLARLEARAAGGLTLVSRAAREAVRGERRPPRRSALRLPAAPASVADYVPPRLRGVAFPFEGDLRRVTMLFLESRGLGVRALQAFALVLQDVLERYDGTLVSPDLCAHGVRWLCTFGAPVSHDDDPDRAARAALDLLRLRPRGIALRGGMHAGVAAQIQVGGEGRASIELMGDVTNTAARAMTQAAWGEVVATGQTLRLLRGVETSSRGSRAVKGKADRLELHALVSARPVARPLDVTAPITGRDEEIRRIRRLLEEAAAGRGAVLSIRGEPGVGKSRLALEAGKDAASLGYAVHVGRAIPWAGMAYWSIADLLRSVLELPPGAPDEESVAAVSRIADRLELEARHRNHLLDLLGVRGAASLIDHMNPASARTNAMIAVRTLLRCLARERPLLLVMDDMHWSDRASAEAVAWVARGIGSAALLLCLLARPGYTPPEGSHELELGELGSADVAALLRAHLGELPGEAGALVEASAGGNPFYVEELVRHLLETGLLERTPSGPRLARPLRGEDVPPGLEAIIAGRLDGLPAAARQVAQRAAVLGRSVRVDVLARIAGRGLPAAVAELRRREILFERPGPTRELIFKHALTRDVAYASILERSRRRLHGEAADAMEAALATERDTWLAMIGRHRELAGQSSAARACYLDAARAAVARHALAEADALYRDHARLCEGAGSSRGRGLLELARDVLMADRRSREAEAVYGEALAGARAAGDRALEGECLRQLGGLLRTTSRTAEALARTEEALAIHRALGDDVEAARDADALAALQMDVGRWEEALRLSKEALAVLEGRQGLEAAARDHLGTLLRRQGRLGDAREHHARALAIRRRNRDLKGEAASLLGLAIVETSRGDNDAAMALYQEALAIQRAIGDRSIEGRLLNSLAILLKDTGRIEEARALYEQSLACHREVGDRIAEGEVIGNLGGLFHAQGETSAASALYEEAVGILSATGARRSAAIYIANLAQIDQDQGRLSRSLARNEEALAVFREVRHPAGEAHVLASLGMLHALQGRLEPARELYLQALAIQREAGNASAEATLLGALGTLAVVRAEYDEAQELYAGALVLRRRTGDRRLLAHVLGEVARIHWDRDERDEAHRLVAESLATLRELGNHELEGALLGQLGAMNHQEGRVTEARACFEEGLHLVRGSGRRIAEAHILVEVAELEHRLATARPHALPGSRRSKSSRS